MGYRSDIVIAVRKDIYLKAQLLQNIPKSLSEAAVIAHPHGSALYWEIHGWKWYEGYPEVQEIIDWMAWLADEEENPFERVEIYRDKDNKPIFSELGAFGAIRVGEDATDIEEWGYPTEFDLYISTAISKPY